MIYILRVYNFELISEINKLEFVQRRATRLLHKPRKNHKNTGL